MPYEYYGFGGYNKTQIKALAELTKNEGEDPRDIYETRPDAAVNAVEIIKTMPPENCAKIIPDAFVGETGRNLAAAFSLSQLAAIGSDGDIFLKAAIKLALEKELQRNSGNPELKAKLEYIYSSPAWQL